MTPIEKDVKRKLYEDKRLAWERDVWELWEPVYGPSDLILQNKKEGIGDQEDTRCA